MVRAVRRLLCIALAGASAAPVGAAPLPVPPVVAITTGAQVAPLAPPPGGSLASPGAAPAAGKPGSPDGSPPASAPRPEAGSAAIPPDVPELTSEEVTIDGSVVHARNVRFRSGEYELSGERLDGDLEREIELTGSPVLLYRGQVFTGDAIRYEPRTHLFRIVNAHSDLSPEFLQGRLTGPLYLSGAEVAGQQGGALAAGGAETTTCGRPAPDYLLRAREIVVEPGKQVTLRHAAVLLWGKRIFTAPVLVIPLGQRRRSLHADYLPHVGRSADEGWFAKSAFNYLAGDRLPGLLRVDLMERKGIGLGVDQQWALARAMGSIVLYAIPAGGTSRNLSGRLNNQFRLGGGQTLTVGTDLQQNSYMALPQTTSLSSRLGYSLQNRGGSTNVTLSRMATTSAGYSTRSTTAGLAEALRLAPGLDLSFGSDYSTNTTGSQGVNGSTYRQHTETLTTRTQVSYRASNYLLQLTANRNVPVGTGTGQSYFSGVEKLPEVTLSNYRFTQGFLARTPVEFNLAAGKYSEGGGGLAGSSAVVTERVIAGFDVENRRVALTPSTDLDYSGGFQQYFYGDGAAQFTVASRASLSQRFYRSSGMRLDYAYQRPQGGTPFRFDQQGQYHTLSGDIGLLGDPRLQLTARVGYDLVGNQFGGFRQPWQTLSANLLMRPARWSRLQQMVSFDPNNGRVVAVTSDMRFRGSSGFAVDMVSRYDPSRHAFGNLNGYLDLPIGSDWRVVTLFQYNGYLSRFESRNLQIVRDLHCMEACLTYSENPFGYRADRQVFFQLRIKAFPVFQRFGVGQYGQAIDTGISGRY